MCGRKRDQVVGTGGLAFPGSTAASLNPAVSRSPQLAQRDLYQGYASSSVRLPMASPMGSPAMPSYTSFVSTPGAQGHTQALPGDSWESDGCKYHMGDRYTMDGQGQKRVLNSESQLPEYGGSIGGQSFVSMGGALSTAQGALPVGRYGGYGPPSADHLHDLHDAQVIAGAGRGYGPLPPNAAPGTPAMLPPYMMPEASGRSPKRDKSKKRSKDKDKDTKSGTKESRRRKKGGGCCG